jgi:hypothetical protein
MATKVLADRGFSLFCPKDVLVCFLRSWRAVSLSVAVFGSEQAAEARLGKEQTSPASLFN